MAPVGGANSRELSPDSLRKFIQQRGGKHDDCNHQEELLHRAMMQVINEANSGGESGNEGGEESDPVVRQAPVLMWVLPVVGLVLMLKAPVGAGAETFVWRCITTQATVFALTAHVPAWLTGKMAYVDIAWPLGLVAMGLQALEVALAWPSRGGVRGSALVVAVALMAQGGRLIANSLWLLASGGLASERARYTYQVLRWEHRGISEGTSRHTAEMHTEIALRALVNAGCLAWPAVLTCVESVQGAGRVPTVGGAIASLHIVEWFGLLVWCAAFVTECVADLQKSRWAAASDKDSNDVCTIGLWGFSRHPNYFGQWLAWSALAIVALPSAWEVARKSVINGVLSVFMLANVSLCMYIWLTQLTGAEPSEYFSFRKRPKYRDYRKQVPMLIPQSLFSGLRAAPAGSLQAGAGRDERSTQSTTAATKKDK